MASKVSEIHPGESYQQNCTDIWGFFNDLIDSYTEKIAVLCVHLPSFSNNHSEKVPSATS